MKTETQTKFKPVVMSTQTAQETQYNNRVQAQKNAYNELLNYTNEFISVDNFSAFTSEKQLTPVSYMQEFETRFFEKHAPEFPPISVNKMIELMSVNLKYINEKITLINSYEIELNFSTGEPLNTPNFNIQTETQTQNELYTAIMGLIRKIDELKEKGVTIYPAPIVSGLGFAVQFDFATNKIIPNYNYILGKQRGL